MGGGGVTYLHLGVGVPPKYSNPDPISDPKRHFLHFIVSPRGKEGGGGGGGYLPTLGCGRAAQDIQILTLFQTKLQKSIPYFRPDDIRLSQDQYKHRGRRVFRILLIFCSETAKWQSATVILEQIKKIFKVHKLFEKTVPFSRLLK